jgi:secreted trypsin-like serine protease
MQKKGWDKMKRLLKLGALTAFAVALISSFAAPQASAIIGGSNVTDQSVGQYGAVSIWYPDNQGVNRHRCTASVISTYWALTAGHCAAILFPGQTQIRTSSLDNTTGYEDVGLADFYVHPNYVSGGTAEPNKNDIALIKFQRPVNTQKTKPLALLGSSPAIGTQGKIASWGYICDDVASPINCGLPHTKILQELGLKIVSDSTCTHFNDPQNQMCIISNHLDKNACNGDSGAPFVKKGFNVWLLMGIVAGDGDKYFPTPANPNTPNYCTRDENGAQGKGRAVEIAPYVGWILDTIIANGGRSQVPQTINQ